MDLIPADYENMEKTELIQELINTTADLEECGRISAERGMALYKYEKTEDVSTTLKFKQIERVIETEMQDGTTIGQRVTILALSEDGYLYSLEWDRVGGEYLAKKQFIVEIG